jgi:rRNA maturation protein Nop10
MPYPPRFSPIDKYGDYRRKFKMEKAAELADQNRTEAQKGQK